ncbi:hypothetical protein I79_026100 [Cricetulus griseus]|uniref:Uncharacterized protein n=1 Tax=Cricetulus griseus TaxID=10029 RepID=G3IQ15_CRIGR|nr:hypothetical protein I79_026100 [Cricetulus griseus]
MEVLTLKKFRGDLAYRRQEYEVGASVRRTATLEMGSCAIKTAHGKNRVPLGVCCVDVELFCIDAVANLRLLSPGVFYGAHITFWFFPKSNQRIFWESIGLLPPAL